MSANPVVTKFLDESGYINMTAKEQTAFRKKTIPVMKLEEAISSALTSRAKAEAAENLAKIRSIQVERQLLGIRIDKDRVASNEALGIERAEKTQENQFKEKARGFAAIASIPRKLFSGLNNMGLKIPGVPKNQDGGISLSFLLMVLIILWAAFAVVTTSNGVKTTRIKLLFSVIGGNAQVSGS